MSIKGCFRGLLCVFMRHSCFWSIQKCPLRFLHGCKKHNKDNSSLIFNISDTHLGRNRSPFRETATTSVIFRGYERHPVTPPPAPSIFWSSKALPIQWFDRKPHLFVNYAVRYTRRGKLLGRVGPWMCHDIIMAGMIGRAAQVVFYSLPLQSRAVIKRYGRTHECRFLNGAGWSSTGVI